jgi:hypothetical protein
MFLFSSMDYYVILWGFLQLLYRSLKKNASATMRLMQMGDEKIFCNQVVLKRGDEKCFNKFMTSDDGRGSMKDAQNY